MPEEITIFNNSLEQNKNGAHDVGYGYAVFQDYQRQIENSSTINPLVHMFDTEAVGALHRLQAAVDCFPCAPQYWLCIDSISVIWCA